MNPRPKALRRDFLRAQTIIAEVLLLLFPSLTADRHAVRSGELHDVWHGQSLPYAHLPLNDALPGSRSFRVGRLPLIRQQQQQCCCYLIYNLPVLWRSGAAARWSRLHTPVETLTPPDLGNTLPAGWKPIQYNTIPRRIVLRFGNSFSHRSGTPDFRPSCARKFPDIMHIFRFFSSAGIRKSPYGLLFVLPEMTLCTAIITHAWNPSGFKNSTDSTAHPPPLPGPAQRRL